jgi:hypothetical protein
MHWLVVDPNLLHVAFSSAFPSEIAKWLIRMFLFGRESIDGISPTMNLQNFRKLVGFMFHRFDLGSKFGLFTQTFEVPIGGSTNFKKYYLAGAISIFEISPKIWL